MNELKDTQSDLITGLVELGLLNSAKDGLDFHSPSSGKALDSFKLCDWFLYFKLYV